MQSMKDRGIGMLYGRWLIEGAPRVLLIDTKTAYKYLDEWKGDLWNVASIPSPPGDDETNEAIVFGYLVAWFLGEVSLRAASFYGILSSLLVRLSREEEGRHCSFPRMACWCRSAAYQEAAHRCNHHLYHARHSSWAIPLRRLRRLLQQPAMVRC